MEKKVYSRGVLERVSHFNITCYVLSTKIQNATFYGYFKQCEYVAFMLYINRFGTFMSHMYDKCVRNLCDEFVRIHQRMTNTKGEIYGSNSTLTRPWQQALRLFLFVFFIITETYRMPNGYG